MTSYLPFPLLTSGNGLLAPFLRQLSSMSAYILRKFEMRKQEENLQYNTNDDSNDCNT